MAFSSNHINNRPSATFNLDDLDDSDIDNDDDAKEKSIMHHSGQTPLSFYGNVDFESDENASLTDLQFSREPTPSQLPARSAAPQQILNSPGNSFAVHIEPDISGMYNDLNYNNAALSLFHSTADMLHEQQPAMEEQQQLDKQRFTLMDLDDDIDIVDTAPLETLKARLQPQTWRAWLIDKLWDRGFRVLFGALNNDQSRLNAAKDLILKPNKYLICAFKTMTELNATMKEYDGVPITINNMKVYLEWIQFGKFVKYDEEGIQQVGYMDELSQFVQTSWRNLIAQLLKFEEHSRIDSPFIRATQLVGEWSNAIGLLAQAYTKNDTEYRTLLTLAQKKVTDADNSGDSMLVAEFIHPLWTNLDGERQSIFIEEIAEEFCSVLKNLHCDKKSPDDLQPIMNKILERASKIAQITGEKERDVVVKLCSALNKVPAVKKAVKKTQDILLKQMDNNRSTHILARKQLHQIRETFEAILQIDKVATVSSKKPFLNAEESVAASVLILQQPQITKAILALYYERSAWYTEGSEQPFEQDDGIKRSTEHFVHLLDQFEEQTQSLCDGNKKQITQGFQLATDAHEKLDAINKFGSRNNTIWKNVPSLTGKFVWDDVGVQKALFELFADLAGSTDATASPTLLSAFLKHSNEILEYLEPNISDLITPSVLFSPLTFDKHPIQISVQRTDRGVEKVELLTFQAAANGKDKRAIDKLREIIQRRLQLDQTSVVGEDSQ